MSSTKKAEALLVDMEAQAKKSKFGYFTMPPNPFVGDTLIQEKKSHRGADGRVVVSPRNVFSGVTATGILKKSFFSYPAKTPDAYYDPGKIDSLNQLSKSKLMEGKEPYKPPSGSLEPSPTAAYPYVLDKRPPRDPKACRDGDGKVRTENPNISGGTAFKACQNRLKAYMSASTLPLAPIKQKPTPKENQAPFVPCGKKGLQFSTLKETFGSLPIDATIQENILKKSQSIMHHESQFRPSNRALQQDFSRPKYIPMPPEVTPTPRKVETDRNPFKLIKMEHICKPTPSITRVNALRGMR